MASVDYGNHSKRIKLILTIAASIFIVGYLLLVLLEGMDPINAFYFLIVTLSTVGYGDLTPTTPFTKIIVSLLIITGISSLAIISERLVDRLVKISSQQYLDVPLQRLDYQNHIIIVGFTKIAENVAMAFQGRFFRVVVLDPHQVAVERARSYGFEAYFGNPALRNILDQINIQEASAMYLFMTDENRNVLASIQARSLSPDLLIYAETEHELTIDIGNLIGIDRTYHYERIVAANIGFSLRTLSALILPNQLLSPLVRFVVVVVSKDFNYESKISEFYPLGYLHKTLTNFIPLREDTIESNFEKDNYLMLAVPIEEFNRSTVLEPDMVIVDGSSEMIKKILVGGYGEVTQHVLKELDYDLLEGAQIEILTFSETEAKQAQEDGYSVLYCDRGEIQHKLQEACDEETLIINLFERITDSLLVNTAAQKIDIRTPILQIAFDRIQTDVFIRSGVDRIIIPELLMSRGMFLIYLTSKNLINSTVWSNAHLFEHYIDATDPFKGENVHELRRRGYEVLLHRNQDGIHHLPEIGVIREGDNLFLLKPHEFLKRVDQQIVDQHQV